jgi:hypothetical protein
LTVRSVSQAVAAVVAVAAAVIVAGEIGTPRPMAVDTDQLGPAPGTSVADYLARARASLSDSGSDAPRWALLSLRGEITPAAAADLAGDTRVSQVIYHVPLDRVQTPLAPVVVPDGRAAILASAADATSLLLSTPTADDRADRVLAVAAGRIRAGCACVLALVLRAGPDRLRALAAAPPVRAVQALPADAVRFGVTPLLPSQTTLVDPEPDDGPVPPR